MKIIQENYIIQIINEKLFLFFCHLDIYFSKTNIKKKKKLPSMQINFNTNERKEKEADTIEMRFRESQNGRWMQRREYQQAVANLTQYCKAK